VIIEANLPHFLRLGKELQGTPFRLDVVKGFDESGKWWGLGTSYITTENWEISLIGILDKFRDEKIVIADIQANYTFFRVDWFSVSVGLDYGKIFPFKAEYRNEKKAEIEGTRVFPILMFSCIKPSNLTKGGQWRIDFSYSPEFISLESGEFKKNGQNGQEAGTKEIGTAISYKF
jgi:hypothetical protein